MERLNKDFSPSIFHPFYFIRNGLKKEIYSHAPMMIGKMMDFGCGSKPYRFFFKVDEYVGVDFQNEGHPHDQEQIDLFYDGKKLPVENAHFDCVLCSEVIEHIFNLDEVLVEINRVMKNGGHLLLTCPFVWNEHETPFDFARYSRFALEDILKKSGFEIVRYSKSGNFVTTVFQLWSLYWFTILDQKARKYFLVRWAYKFFLIFPANLFGKILNWLLPSNDSLYLNNVILAKKNN